MAQAEATGASPPVQSMATRCLAKNSSVPCTDCCTLFQAWRRDTGCQLRLCNIHTRWHWNVINLCLVMLVVVLTCKALPPGSLIGISGQLLYRNGTATVLRTRQAFLTTGLALLGLCVRVYEFWRRELITNPTPRVLRNQERTLELILCLYGTQYTNHIMPASNFPQELLNFVEQLDDAFLRVNCVRSDKSQSALLTVYISTPDSFISTTQYRRTRLSGNGILSGSAISGPSNNVRAAGQPDADRFIGYTLPTSSRGHHLELLQGSG
jgi:hypothetical protein